MKGKPSRCGSDGVATAGRAYESEQIAHVVERHALVGRVGKRGVEVLAVSADAFQHGVGELQLRPAPIPAFASGEMFGTLKVPNGECS